MGGVSSSAPKSPRLGGENGFRSPRGGDAEPSGGGMGVMSQMARHVLPTAEFRTPPGMRAQPASAQSVTLGAALKEKLKEARARLGRKRRGRKWMLEVLAERVLESTAVALAMAELDSRRKRGQAGSPEDTGKSNRRKRDLEGKRTRSSSSSQEMAAYSSTDEDSEREDESKVRRIAGTKPGALLHSGLIMMHRHLGRQMEVCESVDAVQAKGVEAACLSTALKPNAGSRESQSLAEAVDLLMRGRVASAGDVLIQRFRAVEASALEEGGWSFARHLELLPDAGVSTVSSGLRGLVFKAERDYLRLSQSLRKRSPRERPQEDERFNTRHHRWRNAVEEEQPRADRQRIREEGRMRGNGLPRDQEQMNQARRGKGERKGKRKK